jgi:PAS domain S-box-containing protein
MIDWIEKHLTSWQTWVGLILGSIASMAAVFVALKNCLTVLLAAYRGGVFVIKIEEVIGKFKTEVLERLDRIDEGQANQIQIRRAIMEEDEAKAWFEADHRGHLIWANRLYRDLVGMESDHVRGRGWEAGIAAETRDEVLRDWTSAFDHQRMFERVLIFQCIRDGTRQRVRLSAWPIRRESDGKILSYTGNATILSHERRSSSKA